MRTVKNVLYLLWPVILAVAVIVLFFTASALLSYPIAFIGNLDQ